MAISGVKSLQSFKNVSDYILLLNFKTIQRFISAYEYL